MNRSSEARVRERIEAIVRTARAWRDPEHDARADAVARTLQGAPNRFTAEALAFAVNAATHRLTVEALRAWRGDRALSVAPSVVAVVPGAGGAPLAGLRAVLATLAMGHRCRFVAPAFSPALVPALLGDVPLRASVFAAAEAMPAALEEADAAIGSGDGEAQATFEAQCAEAEVPPERRSWRGASSSVAVLDATEDAGAYEGLAEDALLYEGYGRASVRLIWAPTGTAPDAFLDAMARFRAVFPAHADTPGALQMQKAFLEARSQSHAHGEGLEFLMSRGAPAVQARGHLRWAEYDELDEVRAWLGDRAGAVHATVAQAALHDHVAGPAVLPGTVHRQLVDAPGTAAQMDFAASL